MVGKMIMVFYDWFSRRKYFGGHICDKIVTDTISRIFSKSNYFISSQMNHITEVELLIQLNRKVLVIS